MNVLQRRCGEGQLRVQRPGLDRHQVFVRNKHSASPAPSNRALSRSASKTLPHFTRVTQACSLAPAGNGPIRYFGSDSPVFDSGSCLYFFSIFAAKTKSFLVNPLTLCVKIVTRTLPQVR